MRMTTIDDVEATEARMNAAKDELLNYVEERKALDPHEYRRLVARVKRAEADFLKANFELGNERVDVGE